MFPRMLFMCSLAVSLLPSSAAAQRDVAGWSNLTWATTYNQALSTYAGRIKQNPRGTRKGITDRFTITEIYADDLELEAAVATPDDSDRIVRVTLIPAHSPHDDRYVHSVDYYYEKLLTLLVQKYGPPTFGDTTSEGTLQFWTFPSTTITLRLQAKTVSVLYAAARADTYRDL